MKIIIYTTPTCPYCQQAIDYFRDKKLPFENIDVSLDQKKAEEMVELSGQMGVPLILIDKQAVIGFDQKKIEKLLKSKG